MLLHNGKAYLADFGVSSMHVFKGLTTDVQGNYNFRAPELVFASTNEYFTDEDRSLLQEHPTKPTTFSDMYAYGMLFFEVIESCGCLP